MDIQLSFDSNGIVKNPSFILGNRNASKIGLLTNIANVNLTDPLDDAPQISFDIYKYNNGDITPFYDNLITFKLVYIPEFDTWFEAIVEENESDVGAVKHVSLTRLGEAELSQIHVYGLNINTEDSIIYDEDYAPTILYDPNDPDHSLLDRVLSYAPHYSIGYVAPTVRNIQRTFQFNDQTVLECLKNIAEEESLFIVLDSSANPTGVNRTVSVYDVLSTCNDCDYRGFFTHTCPKCGSTNITEGYGEDTTILVSAEAFGNDLTISTNEESIANCYHLQAGDDNMTAAVRLCNPNGTGYIWSFTDEMYNEMSEDLSDKIHDYNDLYNDYMSNHSYMADPPTQYNALINKYKQIDEDLDIDPITDIVGYPALIKAWYDALDFYYFLKTSLMPSESTDNITAQSEAIRLYQQINNTTVAVGNTANLSLAAASTAVMNNARLIANTIYEVTVQTQTLTNSTWTGTLLLQNFYNKDDKATTQMMTVNVDDDLEEYVAGKVMKTLFNTTQGQSTVVAMYNQTTAQVQTNLQYYSLDELTSINKAFNGAIEILSKFQADKSSSELYTPIYVPTKAKLDLVQAELQLREQEVSLVNNFANTLLNTYVVGTQDALDFEDYLGSDLWIELNSFRREANFSDNNYVSTTFRRKFSYTDSAYISDSLTNGEIIERAYEFLIQAEQKMAENNKYSYQINSSLKNLLVIPEFQSIRDMFRCGNWIRVKNDAGDLYKLRLISFEMSFDDPESLTVSFADVSNTSNVRAAQQIIAQSVDLVKNPKRYVNTTNTKFTSITDDIQCDYVVNDSFTKGSSYDDIEIVNDQMITTFNVLDGLIQGKISQAQAYSLIQQELDRITLEVHNGEYVLVTPTGDENPSAEGWYEQSFSYNYLVVHNTGTSNPQASGWYEYINGSYVLTTDTEVNPDKVYYRRVGEYSYYLTSDTSVDPYTNYYEYVVGGSSMTIKYDGVEIMTTGDITLGGNVIFTSNLTDGVTVINGSNIQTGTIQSGNYNYTSPEIYSNAGSMFDLEHGDIRTPGLYIDGQTGDAWFRGTIRANAGYIGGSPIVTADGSTTVKHAHHTWKLRSQAIYDKDDSSRFYTYMTRRKHLIVSNSEDASHSPSNDVTPECTIGASSYPWHAGYFENLRINEDTGQIDEDGKHVYIRHDVIPEGLPVTLLGGASNWETVLSDTGEEYYQQVKSINGISGNVYLYIATETDSALENVFMHTIDVDTVTEDEVTFVAKVLPTMDIPIILLVEDFVYSHINAPFLDADFDQEKNQLYCTWDSPRDSSKFITWLSDELVIEHCIDEEHPELDESWEEVLVVPQTGEEPFEPDEFSEDPLVIGSPDEEEVIEEVGG